MYEDLEYDFCGYNGNGHVLWNKLDIALRCLNKSPTFNLFSLRLHEVFDCLATLGAILILEPSQIVCYEMSAVHNRGYHDLSAKNKGQTANPQTHLFLHDGHAIITMPF